MGTTIVVNNSTLTDSAALCRVGSFIAGDMEQAICEQGSDKIVVDIMKKGQSTYIVNDWRVL